MNRRRPSKNGYILVAVLVCISLVLALTLGALQTAMRMRREVIRQHLLSQSSLLCETGLARAALRLRDGDYAGEIWKPEMPELPGKRAEVTIVFLERGPTGATVQVTAVLDDLSPNHDHSPNHHRICRSLTTRLVNKSKTKTIPGENP